MVCFFATSFSSRLDGNIDIGTTCSICHEEITSFVNLTGKRCVWCQRVVHEYSIPSLSFLIVSAPRTNTAISESSKTTSFRLASFALSTPNPPLRSPPSPKRSLSSPPLLPQTLLAL